MQTVIASIIAGMDELYFDNKKYVTTKKAAAIANYAKDYVGQLARSGKIDARLIGRNWYISEEALIQHAFGSKQKKEEAINSDHESTRDSDALEVMNDEAGLVERPVSEQHANVSVNQHEEKPIQNYGLNTDVSAEQYLVDEIVQDPTFATGNSQDGAVRYWTDDSDLMPTVNAHAHDGGESTETGVHVTLMEQAAYAHRNDFNGHLSHSRPLQHEDVSKITLTLRSRLRSSDSVQAVGMAGDRAQRTDPLGRNANEDEESPYRKAGQWHVDGATVTKVLILLVCLTILVALMFAMMGESSVVYIRK